MNYLLRKIPEQWTNTHGKNSVVMICDTGCDIDHVAIAGKVIDSRSFSQSVMSTNSRHGTHISGIICGNSNEITGVASESKLIIAQIMKGISGNYEWLTSALQWAITLEFDVMNLSFAYPHNNKKIYDLLKQLTDRGVIVLSAYASYPDIFPSSYDNIISVASYGQSYIKNESKIDLYAHNTFSSSVPMNKYAVISGNSMSTAYCSGIAALAKSFDKNITKEKLLAALLVNQESFDFGKKVHCRVST